MKTIPNQFAEKQHWIQQQPQHEQQSHHHTITSKVVSSYVFISSRKEECFPVYILQLLAYLRYHYLGDSEKDTKLLQYNCTDELR